MEDMKYARLGVLEKLKSNRIKHHADYENAIKGFKEAVVVGLELALTDAKAGKEYRLVLNEYKPTSYLTQYDRAIAMFEMSIQEEVVLTMQDFTQYVLDIWSWSDNFTAATSKYSK